MGHNGDAEVGDGPVTVPLQSGDVVGRSHGRSSTGRDQWVTSGGMARKLWDHHNKVAII